MSWAYGDTEFEIRWFYDISHLFLAIEYLALVLVCIGVLAYVFKQQRGLCQIGFFMLYMIACSLRAFFFTLQPFLMEESIQINNQINFMLNNFPSLIFFSCYSVMLYVLANIYHNGFSYQSKGSPKTRIILYVIFALANMLQYLFTGLMYILDFTLHDPVILKYSNGENMFEWLITLYTASAYIIISISFYFYGYQVYQEFKKIIVVDNSERTSGTKFRLKVMLTIIPTCFIIRAVIMTADIFGTFSNGTLFDLLYFSLLEVLPLALLLRVSIRLLQSHIIVQPLSLSQQNYNPADSYRTLNYNSRDQL